MRWLWYGAEKLLYNQSALSACHTALWVRSVRLSRRLCARLFSDHASSVSLAHLSDHIIAMGESLCESASDGVQGFYHYIEIMHRAFDWGIR